MLAYCELCWKYGSQAASSFFYWRSLSNRPLSLSISFDYPHAKIQIPQDTNSLSQNNYKMLYATVNTTSVTVTVCICHEMRQKQKEFALMNRMREEDFFFIFFSVCVCCLLTVLWAFVPASSQMSLNVSHGICCRREQIRMRASCFDRLVCCTLPLLSVKSQDISLHSFSLFRVLFLFCDVS